MSPEINRKFQRVDLSDEVYLEQDRFLKPARWTDISLGGIYVQTKSPLPVGDFVKLRIRIPRDKNIYKAAGVVRHSLTWVGMGVEFTQLPPATKHIIEKIQTS